MRMDQIFKRFLPKREKPNIRQAATIQLPSKSDFAMQRMPSDKMLRQPALKKAAPTPPTTK